MNTTNFLTILLFLSFFMISSCSKNDDTCTPKPFKENIIGTWNIKHEGPGFNNSGTGNFNADGTFYTSPEDLLIETELAGIPLNRKIYTITGTIILIEALSASGHSSSSADGEQTTNECNKIVISAYGGLGVVILTR